MTAFDHFQVATCDISGGNYADAIKHIDASICIIDKNGVDQDLRADLVNLRAMLAK